MDLEAMKAAFAAKGGKVTVVSEGASNGMTTNDWRYAVRGEKSPRQRREEATYDEGAHERYRERVNDAYMMGGSAAAQAEMDLGPDPMGDWHGRNY